jgi:hypothetical protein
MRLPGYRELGGAQGGRGTLTLSKQEVVEAASSSWKIRRATGDQKYPIKKRLVLPCYGKEILEPEDDRSGRRDRR